MEYVFRENRPRYRFEPFDATEVHYVRSNLLILVFAHDPTECERRFSLEGKRNQIALLTLVCESPDLAQSGDDLFFTFARICLLVERS